MILNSTQASFDFPNHITIGTREYRYEILMIKGSNEQGPPDFRFRGYSILI